MSWSVRGGVNERREVTLTPDKRWPRKPHFTKRWNCPEDSVCC